MTKPTRHQPGPRDAVSNGSPVPVASVIIPTFNRCWVLPTAVRSAAAQTLDRIEIVVVDDGSTDETPEVCRQLAAKDPRITVLRQENRGLPAARNAGVAVARADWVACLDDDDLWHPRFLEAMHDHAIATGGAAVACRAASFHASTEVDAAEVLGDRAQYGVAPWPPGDLPGEITAGELVLRPLAPPHAGLFRRTALDRLGGYDERVPPSADYDLWLRLAAQEPIPVLAEILALIRIHPSQMTHQLGTMAASTRQVVERFVAAHPEIAEAVGRSRVRRRIADLAREESYAALLHGRGAEARRAAVRALRARPGDLKAWAYLGFSPFPALYRRLRTARRERSQLQP